MPGLPAGWSGYERWTGDSARRAAKKYVQPDLSHSSTPMQHSRPLELNLFAAHGFSRNLILFVIIDLVIPAVKLISSADHISTKHGPI
jgi:hypothetical protein